MKLLDYVDALHAPPVLMHVLCYQVLVHFFLKCMHPMTYSYCCTTNAARHLPCQLLLQLLLFLKECVDSMFPNWLAHYDSRVLTSESPYILPPKCQHTQKCRA